MTQRREYLWLVLLFAGLVWAFSQSRDTSMLSRVLDQVSAEADSAAAQYRRQRAAWGTREADLLSRLAVADTVMRRTAIRRDTVLIEAQPILDASQNADSVRVAAREIIFAVTEYAQACEAKVAVLAPLYGGCRALLDSAVTVMQEQERALDLEREVRRHALNPSFFERARRGIPWVAVGVVLGALVAR